jgi:ribosomal protein S27AE
VTAYQPYLREARTSSKRLMARTVGTPRELSHPQLTEAYYVVKLAIKLGWLRREPCAVCGVSSAEAHHADYAKPLMVRWLCRLHHRRHHARLGRSERAL